MFPRALYILIAWVALLLPAPPTNCLQIGDGRTVTFHGSFHRHRLRFQNTELALTLSFKTPHLTGLLLAVRLENNNGFIALGFKQGQVQALIEQPGSSLIDMLHIGSLISNTWHSLDIQLMNNSLNTSLNSVPVFFSLSSPISLKDIYFGGAHTFFAPIFIKLDITEYFVGCLSYVRVNGQLFNFPLGYGMEPGCCSQPRPVTWGFPIENSNVQFWFNKPRSMHSMFFQIFSYSDGDGIVLSSQSRGADTGITMELYNGTLRVLMKSVTLQCPGMSTKEWHNITITVTHSDVHCTIDGSQMSSSRFPHPLPIITGFTVGQPTDTGHLFIDRLSSPRVHGRLQSFRGRISKVQFNNREVYPADPDSVNTLLECDIPSNCSQLYSSGTCIAPNPIPFLQSPSSPSLSLTHGEKVTLTKENLLASDNYGGLNKEIQYIVIQDPRHGILLNQVNDDMTHSVQSFTQDNVNRYKIYYQHTNLAAAGLTDSFSFKVCINSICTEEYTFSFILNSIELTVVNTGFSVVEGGTHRITPSEFSAMAPNGETVRFYISKNQPRHGSVVYSFRDSTVVQPHEFDDTDVESGFISYIHSGSESLQDSFEFTATAICANCSHLSFTSVVNIKILPVNNKSPVRINISTIIVMNKGEVPITSSQLSFFDFDSDANISNLTYMLPSSYPYPLQGDLVFKDAKDVRIQSFTEGDIRAGRLLYKHRYATVQDIVVFVVTDGLHKVGGHFFVNVSFPPYISELTVTNTGFTVIEGGVHYIKPSELSAMAPNEDTVRFDISRNKPKHGSVMYTFKDSSVSQPPFFYNIDIKFGFISYIHSGSESLQDSFEFTATAICANCSHLSFTSVVNIKILPVNNKSPVAINISTISVMNGGEVTITSSKLSFFDFDSDANISNLTYLLPSSYPYPVQGDIVFKEAKDVRIQSFTEGDIRAGRLLYKHRHAMMRDLVVFVVTDGLNQLAGVLNVNVTNLNLKGKAGFSVIEGGTVSINSSHIYYSSPSDSALRDSDLHYSIIQPPKHGRLTFNGFDASYFTQADLIRGGLVYVHDHSDAKRDTFQFNITVPARMNATLTRVFTCNIIVEGIDDNPPEVISINNPLFVGELESLTFTSSDLNVVDFDAESIQDKYEARCNIVDVPSFGTISRYTQHLQRYRFSRFFTLYDLENSFVRYEHLRAGEWEDSFSFTTIDKVPNENLTLNWVNITVIPRVIPVEMKNMVVSEGCKIDFHPSHFIVSHPYLSQVPGRINITEAPRHGRIIHNLTTEDDVSSFTTNDLASGNIYYHHNDDESRIDKFAFIFQNLEPINFIRSSEELEFVISVEPINDHVPEFEKDGLTELRLWVGETVTLGREYLLATNQDNPPVDLQYNISISSGIDAHVAFSSFPDTEISIFTLANVTAGQVLFVHRSGRMGKLTVVVSDGVHSITRTINITAVPLSLSVLWHTPVVPMGERVILNRQYLDTTTNDDEPREIQYKVSGAQYGYIEVDYQESSGFTQEEVDGGRVVYVHTEIDVWEVLESMVISIATPLADTQYISFTIYIDRPASSYSLLAANEPLLPLEGGQYCISESMLDARNFRYSTWKQYNIYSLDELSIVFRLEAPAHGTLLVAGEQAVPPVTFTQSQIRNSTQYICYQHDASEIASDNIPFSVSIEPEGSQLDVFSGNITVIVTLVDD